MNPDLDDTDLDDTDLYRVLGVGPAAGADAISRAYRALVREHHPDSRAAAGPSGDAAHDRALGRVMAAYEVLRDPGRRARYDGQRHGRPSPTPAPARVPVVVRRTGQARAPRGADIWVGPEVRVG
ncbi:J domain-containing protein [Georgenia sp. M64]|uniref:J domain-containing protein n=1 Tax=Georgenia sp. M64 TaxID=3120520 RepID=UPI0030E2CAFF